MECEEARMMIESSKIDEEFRAHLEICVDCQEEYALWSLIGEAGELEPGLALAERVLDEVKKEEKRTSWGQFRDLLGRYFLSSGTLDEFSDFPPDSFGAFMFGQRRT